MGGGVSARAGRQIVVMIVVIWYGADLKQSPALDRTRVALQMTSNAAARLALHYRGLAVQ